jgi:hypothetical protein
MELDSEWLTKLEHEDQKYAEFYKEETKKIEVYCLYINQKNELKFGHKQILDTEKGIFTKERLVKLIKENITYNSLQYKPFSIIKYNFTLNPSEIKDYLDNPIEHNFLTTESIQDVVFQETIGLFNNLNSLYVLFYEPHKLASTGKTKKIYINTKKTKRNRQTKKKQLKA